MRFLKASSDFQRVRREGRLWTHPLVILIASRSDQPEPRFGVAAGKSVGGAVQRNRAKRRLREAARRMQSAAAPGWDILLIARPPLIKAPWSDLMRAVTDLAQRAKLTTRDAR